jgi:RsiW-degrading membrane proteinase PrsW (M82 family)
MSIVILVVVAATLFTPFLGGGDLSVRVLLAIAPGLLIMERLVRADRFPEPASLLLITFAGGAASCFVAGPLEIAVHRLTQRLFEGSTLAWLASDFSRAFAGAAVCEETVKYVLVLLCMRRPAFDEPFDGMVYGVTVSLGFAALENIFYVAGQGDSDAALKVAFLRALTAVPSHAATGAIMGFFLGLSHRRRSGRSVLLVAAWAAPVALHGAYDFILFVNPRFGGALGRFWLMVFRSSYTNSTWRGACSASCGPSNTGHR